MSPSETQAVLTISLLAAFADGSKHERERAEIRRIAEALSNDDAVRLPSLVQDVLMKRVTLASTLPALASEESRHLAYEMAVCVCDADGAHSPAEQAFLGQLRQGLGLELLSADGFVQQAESLSSAPLGAGLGLGAAAAAAAAGAAAASTAAAQPGLGGAGSGGGAAGALVPQASVDSAAMDKQILDASILNGALELLPESLSTMAIIPLQMRLVYQIGKAHGYELDSGHIKDFLAAAGVGLTSQYLESAGRKLLGGLLKRVGGGGMIGSVLGGVGKQAVSSGMSFASTYALGHVAKRYYAGGRTFSAQMLKDSYASVSQQAQGLYSRHLPTIQEKARTLDTGKVLAMVRGR
ncbi:MAG: TerB family tellurite resistance protein [Rubrivivax sp.]|nr:TerB family tellurite resistance protein [Rubrivivax sp.]